MPDTYNDLQIVRRYVDEITTYIQAFIQNENVSVILACQVFEDHKKRESTTAFPTENERATWLFLRARNTAMDYLKGQRNEKIKTEAVRQAIHDYP